MNAQTKLTPDLSPLDREMDQIEALRAALDKRLWWLRQQRSVAGHPDDTGKRLYCRYADLAAREEVDVLRCGYYLFEVDGLWDAYMDASNATGLEIYDDRAAIVAAGRAAMTTAQAPVSDPQFYGSRFGG